MNPLSPEFWILHGPAGMPSEANRTNPQQNLFRYPVDKRWGDFNTEDRIPNPKLACRHFLL